MPANELVELLCPNCGAALGKPDPTGDYACTYCGHRSRPAETAPASAPTLDAEVPRKHREAVPSSRAPWLEALRLHWLWLDGSPSGKRADFSGAELVQVDLSGIRLSKVIFAKASLVQAQLSGANLSGADLEGADLTQADLTGARLVGANLSGADLTQAQGVDLTGARFWRATLTQANIVRGPLLRRFVASLGYEALCIGLALCIPLGMGIHARMVEKGEKVQHAPQSPPGDMLLGKALSKKFQTIDVPYASPDERFEAMPPPAWVARVASTWRGDARLDGTYLSQVDADGFVNLSGGLSYQYYSSGEILDLGLASSHGVLRVSAKTSNAMGYPPQFPGPIACSLRQAFGALATAGRLPAQSTYLVTLGNDRALSPRWEIQLHRVDAGGADRGAYENVMAAVDPQSCAIIQVR